MHSPDIAKPTSFVTKNLSSFFLALSEATTAGDIRASRLALTAGSISGQALEQSTQPFLEPRQQDRTGWNSDSICASWWMGYVLVPLSDLAYQ